MLLIGAIKSRNDFGPFLTSLGLKNTAVEVGTHWGEFAATLLYSWNGFLYCVDPWTIPPEYVEQARGLKGGGMDRERDYDTAVKTLAPYQNRTKIFRATSEEEAPMFGNETQDFVYIDANHEPPHVEQDLALWYPKLRKGGILAGHDIVCLPGADNWGWSIQPAVMHFADTLGLDVNLVPEPDGSPWSWYICKP